MNAQTASLDGPNIATAREGLTRQLVARCLSARWDDLPTDVQAVAAQCVLDWLGVSLAGVDEAGPRLLLDELAARGGKPEATVAGTALRLPAASAAEYNGTLGHVLDYDDVHMAITGHATAAILPALLALAEQRAAAGTAMQGGDLLAALVAGCDMVCRVGLLIAPSHYARGFHSTSTAGSLGAALACAHLLRLREDQACTALGLAASQASGLKAMFGAMGKPWHAGLAARNGLMAAQLAARGFDGPTDILEHPQGFAAAYSGDFHAGAALAEPPGGWHIRATLFKYHASCYGTNACMEALLALKREHGFAAADVERLDLLVHTSSATVCNIPTPTDGTEAKFSLRGCTAMALAGLDTSAPATFGTDSLAHEQVQRLVPRTTVSFSAELPRMAGEVQAVLRGGRLLHRFHDAGVASADVAAQQVRVETKFHAIVAPLFGDAAARAVVQAVGGLTSSPHAPLDLLVTALRGCVR